MSTITEIENAIEKLSAAQVEQLAEWLEKLRVRRAAPAPIEGWLERARGVAIPGETTASITALTRGEE